MLKYLITFGLAIAAGFAGAQTVTNPAFVAMACAFNTVVPSPTNGTFYFVQCDSTGKVLVSGSAPTGAAGGALSGTYPNPSLAATQTQAITWNAASAASAPASYYTGAIFTGGSGTTTFPHVFVQPSGATAATTWSTSGTVFGANAATGFAGNFADYRVAGASFYSVSAAGAVTGASFMPTGATVPVTGIYSSTGTNIAFATASTIRFNFTGTAFQAANASGPVIYNTAASSTNPSMVPQRGDTTTGIGAQAAGNISLITAATEQVRIVSGGMLIPTIALDTALTDTTVCQDTTNHKLFAGSGALGICLGTSGRQFKRDLTPMPEGLAELMQIKFYNYHYINGHGDNGLRRQYGTTAQDVEAALPDLVRHNAAGEAINYDSGALLVITMRAVQELKAELDILKSRQ